MGERRLPRTNIRYRMRWIQKHDARMLAGALLFWSVAPTRDPTPGMRRFDFVIFMPLIPRKCNFQNTHLEHPKKHGSKCSTTRERIPAGEKEPAASYQKGWFLRCHIRQPIYSQRHMLPSGAAANDWSCSIRALTRCHSIRLPLEQQPSYCYCSHSHLPDVLDDRPPLSDYRSNLAVGNQDP